MSVGLYPLDYVDPKTLKVELDDVISGIQGGNSKEMLGGLVRVVPLERLNSILLIGSTASALREVEIWMHRLDKPGDKAGKRLFVYHVQNAKATELSDILNDIFKGSGASERRLRPVQLAPGLQPTEITNKQKATAPAMNNTPGTAGSGLAISPANSGRIKITIIS